MQLSKNGRQKFNHFTCNNPTTTLPPSNSQRPPLLLRADTPTTVAFGPPLNLLAEGESWDDLCVDTSPTFSLGPSLLPWGETWDDPFQHLVEPTQFHEAQEHEALQKEAELDRLNKEQVDTAIAASQAEFQQSFLPETNQPMASSSCLRSSTPPPSPALQVSQSQQPLEPSLVFFSEVPMTKVPANSKNKPKITMQMVPTWMHNLDDRTNQPQAIVSASCCGQVDLEMIHKFRIIWWAQVCLLWLIFAFANYSTTPHNRATHPLQYSWSRIALTGQSGR